MNQLNVKPAIVYFAKKITIPPRNKKTHAHYAKPNLGQLKIPSIFLIRA